MAGARTTRGVVWRRRALALLALAAVAAAVWLLLLGGGDAVRGRADSRGADVAELEIDSRAVGARQPVTVIVPDQAPEDAPMLVFLHGRGGDHETELSNAALFETLDELGERAPIVALPDGGDSSFWHNRASGAWATYVTDEVIPRVAKRFDGDPERVAIGGISMGGFGALNLARLDPGRFCAVGGHSPALWQTAGETAAGAFDDADDFAANDVIGAAATDPSAFAEQPVWLDIGDADPFLPGYEALVAALGSAGVPVTERVSPGGHDREYWDAQWDRYLRFYARSLAGC